MITKRSSSIAASGIWLWEKKDIEVGHSIHASLPTRIGGGRKGYLLLRRRCTVVAVAPVQEYRKQVGRVGHGRLNVYTVTRLCMVWP